MKKLLVGLTAGGCVAFAVAAFAAPAPIDASSTSFFYGALVVIGIQVIALLTLATQITRWMDKRVDARMLAPDSVFAAHRTDPYAHEPMRRQMLNEFNASLEKIRVEMATAEKHHHDDLGRLTEVMKPLIENNRVALEIMATQMRRHTVTNLKRGGDDPGEGSEG